MISKLKLVVILVFLTIHATTLHVFIQIPAYIFIKLNPLIKNKQIYTICSQQALIAWGHVSVIIMQYCLPVTLVLSGLSKFPRENAIVISNHLTYADWLFLWMIAHYNNRLAGIKIILKESPKYVPIFGSAMVLFEFIFLKRKWEQDKPMLAHKLQSHVNTNDMFLMIFPEGTILADDTCAKSKDFCLKNNLVNFIYLESIRHDTRTTHNRTLIYHSEYRI
eukprot:NODE_121_length_17861_cov_0.498480.p8 type:complete len:221 gc:universal NODE_121_length_17861_cov_0.498480:15832-16494(+)